ncbi:hypothetical protein ACFQZJ_02005 [Maribacter chungangensis]|uniref:Uncharacterized protein n=1 Tax=Maribacter chungangensis TaxID=1069117 RepID=A0ABW3B0R9_9FLAO
MKFTERLREEVPRSDLLLWNTYTTDSTVTKRVSLTNLKQTKP